MIEDLANDGGVRDRGDDVHGRTNSAGAWMRRSGELEQALWSRMGTEGLVHHSDRGCQYLSIRYTERLVEVGIESSVGSTGDSYDNALVETVNGLYKTEVIPRRGTRAEWKVTGSPVFALTFGI